MPVKTDEIADSLAFFESLLKENYGEFRFRKAMQIIEDFPGDIYKDERKILQRLSAKELFGAGEVAQNFLYECTSFLLMKQNIQGFQGKPIGLLTVWLTFVSDFILLRVIKLIIINSGSL